MKHSRTVALPVPECALHHKALHRAAPTIGLWSTRASPRIKMFMCWPATLIFISRMPITLRIGMIPSTAVSFCQGGILALPAPCQQSTLAKPYRSEEHKSELQLPHHLLFPPLL